MLSNVVHARLLGHGWRFASKQVAMGYMIFTYVRLGISAVVHTHNNRVLQVSIV